MHSQLRQRPDPWRAQRRHGDEIGQSVDGKGQSERRRIRSTRHETTVNDARIWAKVGDGLVIVQHGQIDRNRQANEGQDEGRHDDPTRNGIALTQWNGR